MEDEIKALFLIGFVLCYITEASDASEVAWCPYWQEDWLGLSTQFDKISVRQNKKYKTLISASILEKDYEKTRKYGFGQSRESREIFGKTENRKMALRRH